jgi:regulator of sigma E protease
LKLVFSRTGASQIGGFGAIGGLFSATWDWQVFWNMTAFLSIILAFMNILPIPALDGGHVVFLLYEMVTGRAPDQRVLEVAQMIGMVLLLGLILFANGNDLFKAITR